MALCAAGIDIDALIAGAAEMRRQLQSERFDENPALQYAAYRQSAYRSGKKIEILAFYQENLEYLAEWWKQLFGESEGKEGKGIFPTSVQFSTDLHSLGQWMQEGEKNFFESVLDLQVEQSNAMPIPHMEENTDQLNYLSASMNLHQINATALEAVLKAHREKALAPCLRIAIREKLDAACLGALLYFFEYSCALSAYMLGVNPFDQPGVEAYKNNMFAMLEKKARHED